MQESFTYIWIHHTGGREVPKHLKYGAKEKFDPWIFKVLLLEVAKFYKLQPHTGSSHFVSVKNTKIDKKKKGVSHIKLF